MKKIFGLLAVIFLFSLAPGFAAGNKAFGPANPSAGEDKTPPSYDMKAQALLDLQGMHKRMVELAEAIPADKYTWRPEAGTRSVSELFLHVTAANHNIPAMMTGVTAEETFKAKGFETSTTDKAKIIDELDKSFVYAEAAIQSMSNADFARPEKKLGPEANSGDVIYILVTHNHEHFGQSIAYARMNGVTPPWTAEAEKKAKEAKDGDASKQK